MEDRKAATECAVRCTPPGASVIVHVGTPTTDDAVQLTRHAEAAGAHYVSALPPVGNYSFNEVKDYYTAIASASKLPLLVYYFPSLSKAIQTTEQVLELCAIPNVAGLKYTDSDFFRLWAIRKSGAVAFVGSDEMLVSGLIANGSGGIGSTYNLIPGSYVELFRQVKAGNWEEARKMQDKINDFIRALLIYPIHPVIKHVLLWTGINCGSCILPRRELSLDEQEILRARVLDTELGRELLAAYKTC
jgi:N-acetylneuraminate lyase